MFRKTLSVLLVILIGFGPSLVQAQQFVVSQLPVPGNTVGVSPVFDPVLVKGLVIFPREPLKFRFLVDSGNDQAAADRIKEESERMVKYFLAAVTVPEKDQWVNLSPVEHDRMIADTLGQTDLGRDMLAQDYVLKQFTASMLNPDSVAGKEFWSRVYAEAQARFGSTDVPVDAFNKVWIMPDTAEVFEQGNGSTISPQSAVYVTKAHLKVMLDVDYAAANQRASSGRDGGGVPDPVNAALAGPKPEGAAAQPVSAVQVLAKDIMREVVLPAIEREVNTGANFATVRQIYYAGILARWYRDAIKDTLMASAYMDQGKTRGVDAADQTLKEQIYQRYIAAYQKGVVNFIREENNPATGEVIPRKYFSGGIPRMMPDRAEMTRISDPSAVTSATRGQVMGVDFSAKTNIDAESATEQEWVNNLNGSVGSNEFEDRYEYSLLSREINPRALLRALARTITSRHWDGFQSVMSDLKKKRGVNLPNTTEILSLILKRAHDQKMFIAISYEGDRGRNFWRDCDYFRNHEAYHSDLGLDSLTEYLDAPWTFFLNEELSAKEYADLLLAWQKQLSGLLAVLYDEYRDDKGNRNFDPYLLDSLTHDWFAAKAGQVLGKLSEKAAPKDAGIMNLKALKDQWQTRATIRQARGPLVQIFNPAPMEPLDYERFQSSMTAERMNAEARSRYDRELTGEAQEFAAEVGKIVPQELLVTEFARALYSMDYKAFRSSKPRSSFMRQFKEAMRDRMDPEQLRSIVKIVNQAMDFRSKGEFDSFNSVARMRKFGVDLIQTVCLAKSKQEVAQALANVPSAAIAAFDAAAMTKEEFKQINERVSQPDSPMGKAVARFLRNYERYLQDTEDVGDGKFYGILYDGHKEQYVINIASSTGNNTSSGHNDYKMLHRVPAGKPGEGMKGFTWFDIGINPGKIHSANELIRLLEYVTGLGIAGWQAGGLFLQVIRDLDEEARTGQPAKSSLANIHVPPLTEWEAGLIKSDKWREILQSILRTIESGMQKGSQIITIFSYKGEGAEWSRLIQEQLGWGKLMGGSRFGSLDEWGGEGYNYIYPQSAPELVRRINEHLESISDKAEKAGSSFKDPAMGDPSGKTVDNSAINGGIDIQNIDVAKTGNGLTVAFDAAALKALVDHGFDGLTPVFLGITPLESPLPALGVK
ncbi:MAG: hypothetical protein HQL20_08255 [Candidatus Omnitrophica bacterium]|nr:hypothetical protein [Candidatus Omnitrophota bacterium]